MRTLALLALLLASCGERTLTLPDDPIDRAATCGVVAAASARAGQTNIEAPLTFDQQGQILHYAMLEGAAGEAFQRDRVAQVTERMSAVEADVTSGKWQTLAEPCRAAYPATQATEIDLPGDPLVAQQGCDALSDFLGTALRARENDYSQEFGKMAALERKLDSRIGATEARRGGATAAESADARNRAMSTLVKLGSPAAVLRACFERYG